MSLIKLCDAFIPFRLGAGARDALNKVGSAFIQNLRFRDVWYFVGQKGIQGFSRIEQVSHPSLKGQIIRSFG